MTEAEPFESHPFHGVMPCRNGACNGNVEVLPRIALEIEMVAGVVRLTPVSVEMDSSVMECRECGASHTPESARMARYLRDAIDDLAYAIRDDFVPRTRPRVEAAGRAGSTARLTGAEIEQNAALYPEAFGMSDCDVCGVVLVAHQWVDIRRTGADVWAGWRVIACNNDPPFN
ncbi:hypothetical protein [Yinghuangia sp. YIM S09857]|uniref:hypothetical protein n=1 Tax=Yinghuangia sp. YIM S09857 TaxID=3436929 RepID=UPI003F52D604